MDRLSSFSILLALQILSVGMLGAQEEGKELSSAAEVLFLSGEEAGRSIPVSITGVVTAAHPTWEGQFFIQDSTGGIFVDSRGENAPVPGDVVRLSGVSHPGGFAPAVSQPQWEKIGTSRLPTAKSPEVQSLFSGAEDSQRIEVEAIVRTVELQGQQWSFYLMFEGHRLQAVLPNFEIEDPQSLIGARVRLRGTVAATFNGESRQVISVNLFIPVLDDFELLSREERNPFEKEVILISALGQFSRSALPSERVRLQGVVTNQQAGEGLFIQDRTGGLYVRTTQLHDFKLGTLVEVVGFSGFERHLPVLQDALVSEVEESVLPAAQRLPLEELKKSHRSGLLVSLDALLLDRSVSTVALSSKGKATKRVTLTLQSEGEVFTAEGPVQESEEAVLGWQVGSEMNLTGICQLEIGNDGVVRSFQLLLSGPDSVTVMKKPSWWSPQRLLYGLGILALTMVVAFLWAASVSRKNLVLKKTVKEKAQAQADLQQANENLDQRVRERTAELKFEMDERKKAEVGFRATLAERTRLAQELHDTTEQSLTGIGLQLGTASKLFKGDPESGFAPLEMARTLLERSHSDLRRSIWELRSRELEDFDLFKAMRMSAKEVLLGSGVELIFETEGESSNLPEILEENLLRIARESCSNVVKHASANALRIFLKFSPDSVFLEFEDDGVGFERDLVPGASEGHFGLLGIAERVKRFDGSFELKSELEKGTLLRIEIPVASNRTGAATAEESLVREEER